MNEGVQFFFWLLCDHISVEIESQKSFKPDLFWAAKARLYACVWQVRHPLCDEWLVSVSLRHQLVHCNCIYNDSKITDVQNFELNIVLFIVWSIIIEAAPLKLLLKTCRNLIAAHISWLWPAIDVKVILLLPSFIMLRPMLFLSIESNLESFTEWKSVGLNCVLLSTFLEVSCNKLFCYKWYKLWGSLFIWIQHASLKKLVTSNSFFFRQNCLKSCIIHVKVFKGETEKCAYGSTWKEQHLMACEMNTDNSGIRTKLT